MLEILSSANGKVVSKWVKSRRGRHSGVAVPASFGNTRSTEERTFRALAFEVNARVAIAEQDLDRAQDCLAKALQSMEGFEVPLAHWRVHATAAELHRRLGSRDLADDHRELSRATIMKLANSLPVEEPLCRTFLSAPAIRKVIGDKEARTQTV